MGLCVVHIGTSSSNRINGKEPHQRASDGLLQTFWEEIWRHRAKAVNKWTSFDDQFLSYRYTVRDTSVLSSPSWYRQTSHCGAELCLLAMWRPEASKVTLLLIFYGYNSEEIHKTLMRNFNCSFSQVLFINSEETAEAECPKWRIEQIKRSWISTQLFQDGVPGQVMTGAKSAIFKWTKQGKMTG